MAEEVPRKPLLLKIDPAAVSAREGEPAFAAPPDGAPAYHVTGWEYLLPFEPKYALPAVRPPGAVTWLTFAVGAEVTRGWW
jgi:hypothetical protein